MPSSSARATARCWSPGVPRTISPPTLPHPNPRAPTVSPVLPRGRRSMSFSCAETVRVEGPPMAVPFMVRSLRIDHARREERKLMAQGFALFAATPSEVIRASAREAEALGYSSFWVNHPGSTDGLAALAVAAQETRRIDLGIGVIPLHTRDAASIT